MRNVITQIVQNLANDINEPIPIGAYAENIIVKIIDEKTGESSITNLQNLFDNKKINGNIEWIDIL